jgi:hypothetical protein
MAEIDMGNPNDIDAIVDEIMFFIPFRDKSIIASLDENDIPLPSICLRQTSVLRCLLMTGLAGIYRRAGLEGLQGDPQVAGGKMKALALQ